MIINPYVASCMIHGTRVDGLEIAKSNTYTVLVRYKDEVIKRHISKHGMRLTFVEMV